MTSLKFQDTLGPLDPLLGNNNSDFPKCRFEEIFSPMWPAKKFLWNNPWDFSLRFFAKEFPSPGYDTPVFVVKNPPPPHGEIGQFKGGLFTTAREKVSKMELPRMFWYQPRKSAFWRVCTPNFPTLRSLAFFFLILRGAPLSAK